MNKDPLEIMETLEKALSERKKPISISGLSRETKLAHKTVKKYLNLVDMAKTKFPNFEIVKSENLTVIRPLPITKLPESRRISMVRQEYPQPSDSMIFLKGMYGRGAVSKEMAIPLEKSDMLKKMIKQERVKGIKRKFYLTELGKILVEGALRFYPELHGGS